MRSLSLIILSAALLGSAACRPSGDRVDATESGAVATGGASASRGNGDPVAKGAEKATPETLPANLALATTNETEASNSVANHVEDKGDQPTIPAQYRGRWGMVPADCEPGRSDNKGLLTIGDRTLRFYESVGTLKEQRPAIATSYSGLFSFVGEGQEWEKVMTFTRTGDRLVRAEQEGRFTYTRCSPA